MDNIPREVQTVAQTDHVIAKLDPEQVAGFARVLDVLHSYLRAKEIASRTEREYKALADLFWVRIQSEVEQADSATSRGMALSIRADQGRKEYLVVESPPSLPDFDGFGKFLQEHFGL